MIRPTTVGWIPLLLASIAAASWPGCSRPRHWSEAERIVRAYNEALVLAYRTGNAATLANVAGEAEIRRVLALIDLKRAAKLVLESSIEAFELLEVNASGSDGMVVKTRERWRYHDRSLEPGRPVGPVFVSDMWMSWELGREGGRLKVLKGRTLRSEYLEPKGYRPPPARSDAPDPTR